MILGHLPKPHIHRSGGLWQCASRHPIYPGYIAISLESTPAGAYAGWRRQVCSDITRYNLQIHPNREEPFHD